MAESTIAMAAAELVDVPLEPRDVLSGTAGEAVVQRVSFGRTEPTAFRDTTSGLDAELVAYLAERPEHRFCGLTFTCNFRPDDDEPIVETRVGVRLGTAPATGEAGTAAPIVWSMNPELLSKPVTTKVGFSLTPKVMLVPLEVSAQASHERESTREENYIVGTGRDESTAQWFFRRTQSVALEGMHELQMVIRAPAGGISTAEVILAAKIRRRLIGIIPYRAALPAELREVRLPT